jgi:signal transduction histidine kinase/ligand-binding sensor domain-containing protein
MHLSRSRWCVLALSLCSVLAHCAPAWDQATHFADFHHTAWTTEQGAPGDIWAITQTSDGWLWLGGPRGLFRFDGVQFEHVEVPGRPAEMQKSVYTLFAEDSGELWIGYDGKGVSQLKDGRYQHFAEAAGVGGAVTAFARDLDGALWVAVSAQRLLRFDGKQWHSVSAADGGPIRPVTLHVDRQGTLWIADDTRIHQLPRGSSLVQPTDIKVNESVGFVRTPDGRSWYEDALGAHLLPNQAATRARGRAENAVEPLGGLFDRENYFWAIRGGVLRRFALPDAANRLLIEDRENTDRFTRKQGLSGDVHSMIEDREGSLWIATSAGIDRFRRNNIRQLALARADNISYSLAPAVGGGVWVGTGISGRETSKDAGLWKFDGRLTRVATNRTHDIEGVARGRSGVLWVADRGGIWRMLADGRIDSALPLPDPAHGRNITLFGVDATDAPLVSVYALDAYRLRGGAWESIQTIAHFPQGRPTAHALDGQQQLWLGYRNRVAVVKDEQVELYDKTHGLQVGRIDAISVARHTVVAGLDGFAVLDGGHFRSLLPANDASAFEGIHGIVETDDGDLWLSGFRGLVRLSNDAIETALRNGGTHVPVEIFDAQDGYPGASESLRGQSSMVAGDDGKLWLAGTFGVGWLDPKRIHRNVLPPAVHIRSIISGDTIHSGVAALELPKGTQDLQIDYTALSLARPERIRFKYRLDGYDQTWISADARRQAFYTNLPPGDYRFRVTAANDSGVWNETGSAVAIVIPPKFIQTNAFIALCVMAALSLIWAAVTLRIGQVTRRERSRLAERLIERERIARELHDTLLQGMQGLVLCFQGVANQIGLNHTARPTMDQALDQADGLLAEGRDRVKDLRSADARISLRQALLVAAEQMPLLPACLRVIETGAARELHPIVREEVASVAIEAMRNAHHHAAANKIEVELCYDRKQLCISVRDDGCGMEQSVQTHGRGGHFGLIGMRERAKRIRGQLSIMSAPGAGTEICLVVPAGMAYLKDRSKRRG